MSTIDVFQSFADAREPDEAIVQDGLTYGHVRRMLDLLRTVVRARDAAQLKLDKIADTILREE